jgi:hypothetical protein
MYESRIMKPFKNYLMRVGNENKKEWINLTIIMLSESQRESRYCMIPFLLNSRECKAVFSDRGRPAVTGGESDDQRWEEL